MNLRALAGRIGATAVGGPDVGVRDVSRDSRDIAPGWLFVAIRGAKVDGHRFLSGLPAGSAVVCEDSSGVPAGVGWMVVPDARAALAVAAAAVHDDPARCVPVVAVTGTNGKTTVAWFIAEALARATGRDTAYVGTLGVRVGPAWQDSALTTPEAPGLQRALAALVARDGVAAAIEASSVALVQHRLDALPVHLAIFTNLGRDHLDVHGTMAAYAAAKARLFRAAQLRPAGGAPRALLCADDPAWATMAPPADRWLYGVDASADVRVLRFAPGLRGGVLVLGTPDGTQTIRTPVIGGFNALNLAAAWAAGRLLGVAATAMTEALSDLPAPRGRMEAVPDPGGRLLLVDYAHTPEALALALTAVRQATPGRVHVVFGCGGDRDAGKRRPMGEAAAAGADAVWITSDNPRSEDPAAIAAEVARGAPGATVVVDRAAAIAAAVEAAGPGDAVLVAGKGHETEQIVGATRLAFDDAAHLAACARAGGEGS